MVCNLFLGVALTAIYPMTSEMYTIQYRLEIISLGVIFNQLVPSFITLLVGSVEGISLKTPFIFIAVALIPTIYYLTELPDDKTQVGLDEGLLWYLFLCCWIWKNTLIQNIIILWSDWNFPKHSNGSISVKFYGCFLVDVYIF